MSPDRPLSTMLQICWLKSITCTEPQTSYAPGTAVPFSSFAAWASQGLSVMSRWLCQSIFTPKTHCAGTRHALWAGSQGRVPLLVLSPLLPVLPQISVWTTLIHAVSSTHDDAHLGRTRDCSIPPPRRPWITYYLPASFPRQLRVPGLRERQPWPDSTRAVNAPL